MSSLSSPISVGLIGLGTVGSAVAEILTRHAHLLERKLGVPLTLKKICSRRPERLKQLGLSSKYYCADWREIVEDPTIPIVVELIGGETTAKEIILESIRRGKSVVTANKALLASQGREIFAFAQKNKVDLCFEAAVGGGIPILRSLREGFAANEIRSLFAIINGTCNYILSEMEQKGEEFKTTLARAQSLGYAEKNPSFDIDGIDAAQKLALLTAIAYGAFVHPKEIFTEGIREITALDIEYARRFGLVIKLLAIAKQTQSGLQARVHPCMISQSNPLAHVQGPFNAILLEGNFVGPSLLYGQGAGGNPTASAVVGDILEVARNQKIGMTGVVPPLGVDHVSEKKTSFCRIDELLSEYYLRLWVKDQPGVLAKITAILGKYGMSISSVYQHSQKEGQSVPLVILTHQVFEKKMKKAIVQIQKLPVVKGNVLCLRIERE